ncbi:type II and III secretion system protein family protein [Vibrio splendidus]|uniref:type II and III secretion system protein family protein n=1 Tax=Vibrio splendidus TaxID=29497 RepID=UPI000C8177B0|nr:pilus assembly protein N-terminal domain-containing protein [Vibrio splendidus]PMI52574.1 general secretion pathway protein GspD [Vibrio splendidus]PMI77954.1 general secretion pathway protein GspD [Vibrio splendidus]
MLRLKFSWIVLSFIAVLSSISYANTITNLSKGDMKTINVNSDIQSVFISDPIVADYQVIDERKVVVFGKELGYASLAIYGSEGKVLASRKLLVNPNLDYIKQQIQLLFPKSGVLVTNIGKQVVLSGIVSTEEEKDKINELVGTLLDKKKEEYKLELEADNIDNIEIKSLERLYFNGVVNHIEVSVVKQVNVKLSIAEVSHSFLENFGVSYNSPGRSSGVFVNKLKSFSASDIVSVITAIGNDSVGQILAEPNLSVISGETASFLVGGELPVVTVVDGSTNVDYKEFGVRLDLAAKVYDDDKIILTLMPEVSSLDVQYTSDLYDVPALKTRRARTTVQLADGKSFVLGGLLNTEDQESISKIPYIGDIPILGALFRNSGTKRNKTELIIVATVNLVKPVEPNKIQLPTMKKRTTLERFFAIEGGYDEADKIWANEILSTGGFQK